MYKHARSPASIWSGSVNRKYLLVEDLGGIRFAQRVCLHPFPSCFETPRLFKRAHLASATWDNLDEMLRAVLSLVPKLARQDPNHAPRFIFAGVKGGRLVRKSEGKRRGRVRAHGVGGCTARAATPVQRCKTSCIAIDDACSTTAMSEGDRNNRERRSACISALSIGQIVRLQHRPLKKEGPTHASKPIKSLPFYGVFICGRSAPFHRALLSAIAASNRYLDTAGTNCAAT